MQRAFFMAATAGNTGELRRLLQDCPDLLHSRGPMRMTGLCYAASAGRFDSVRFLVDEGAVINHDDIDGNTPLSYACINGDAPLVRLLLERGAHPHRRETEGNDAFRMACEQGHLEVVRCFVELPTKHLNSSNRRGQSGLWLSCSRGHAAVAHLLLTAGADPTAAARGGATAFDVAVSRGHDACVRLLGEWWRVYLLVKARRVLDAVRAIERMPRVGEDGGAASVASVGPGFRVPAWLGGRGGDALEALPEVWCGAGGANGAPHEGDGEGEGDEDVVAGVARYVLCEMKQELFVELFETMGRAAGNGVDEAEAAEPAS